MTVLAAIGFILIGVGIGGGVARWFSEEVPLVDVTKPFRLKAGSKRAIVMITEARLDSSGNVSGDFIDWDQFKQVRREPTE